MPKKQCRTKYIEERLGSLISALKKAGVLEDSFEFTTEEEAKEKANKIMEDFIKNYQ